MTGCCAVVVVDGGGGGGGACNERLLMDFALSDLKLC